ncbi:MAG: SEL1-like repeat protein, partial [Kiritimatiellae bacterium]|nr:SEL1-like repeat protein [Kiritimatiellia bacterium]
DFSVDNAAMREEVLSLLLGVKENGKRKGDGAYNHFINVYLQYPESNWAADAGRRAEVVRAILVDAFGGKVESKVTPEMTTRIRQIQFRDARALFAQGKIDKARERLKEVLNSFPDCPEAISALGDLARCYMLDTSNTNAQLQAQTIIGELAKRFHGNDECLQSAGDELIRLAENWLECGRPDNRIQTYELFFRLYPTHSSCPIYLASFGEKAYQAKDYATALHYFQTTANNYTNSPRAFDALNRIVTIYEETNDRTNAIAAASNYVKRLEMPGKVTQELMTARFRLANAYKDFGIDILRSGTTDAAATAHGKEAIAMAASAFHELAETLKEPPSTSEVNDEERKRNQYLRKAALFCEAFCLDQASGGTEKEKAVALYVNLAEQGDIGAQFHLGSCYINGTGVEKDEAKAFAWYRKAAEQGDARAQCILGAFYEFGTGVEHDYAKAVEWYRKAAKQGDSQGIEALQRIASGK